MVQSVLFENLPYTSKKHTFRNREETVNSNVLVFKNSRIGIGTQDPEENYRVTISGNTVIRGTLTAEILSYTASNLNHLTIDNLGTQEGINLIQRGYDPFITFRSNESGIVDIIDGKGNVGIGTSIAYESLVVQGKVVAKDLLLTGESIYQKPLQVPPIHQTFIVQDRADLDFIVSTDGIYAASNNDVEVYLNGYKLAYYNSNLKDYVVSYSNEYNPPKTYFNITLTSVAKSQDVIDITFWPKTLDQVQGTLGGYSTQSIYSYWDRALDGSVYYSGNVGMGTYKPISKLDVRGRITGTEFYGSGVGLSNVPGAFEKINQHDGIYLYGNIGIGTIYPREKFDVQGNIFSNGTITCSNIIALGTFSAFNTFSSNTNRMVIENNNSSTALRVLQTGLDYPIALFEKGSNEPVMILTPTGKLGIGTNTPLEVLDIRGNLYVSGNIFCSNITNIGVFTTITTTTNQTEQLVVTNAGTATAFTVTQTGYTKVAEFFRSNISLFQVANDGNIGIGTNVPIEKLDVRGNLLTSNLLLAGPNVSITTHPAATLNINARQIVISSDVLPSLCNVYNLGSSNYRFKDLYLSGNTIDLDGTRIQKDNLTGGIKILNSQGVSVDLNTKAIYTSNVGIGTNIPISQLDVRGNIYSTGTITCSNISVIGDFVTLNTITSNTEQMVIQNAGTGPALKVTQSGGNNVAEFYDKESGVALFIGNGGNIGIGTTNPKDVLYVNGSMSVSGQSGIFGEGRLQLFIGFPSNDDLYGWYIGNQGDAAPTAADNDLYFTVKRNGALNVAGYVQDSAAGLQMNFTGQHRCFIKTLSYSNIINNKGLIVSANNNEYMRMSNGITTGCNAITINESLPIVSLSSNIKDKTVFGVISYVEDPNKREDAYGSFVTVFNKEKGDTRVYINSVGEGAIWVSNKNGPLESGDYITTSDILGYGMKQDDDLLHNYTVAKITMDCDFNPIFISKKIILKDSNNENVLDENGNIQWIDTSEYEYAYKIRYINQNGVEISFQNYNPDIDYIAAFVGCTYHCG